MKCEVRFFGLTDGVFVNKTPTVCGRVGTAKVVLEKDPGNG